MPTVSRVPGKVLILGGYAILERPNAGVVLAVISSFRCKAEWEDMNESIPAGSLKVKVVSEQWGGWKGVYVFDSKHGLIPDESSKDRNPYVEKTLGWTLYCVLAQRPTIPAGRLLSITLLADNDFYSQHENLEIRGLQRTVDNLRALPPNCEVRNKSAKTGLGSSAAMISSIVACIFQHLTGTLDVEYAHRVAQLCHAAVQGKIGSGFDVCCAFYGSMKYVRYDPAPLNDCLTALSSGKSSSADSFEKSSQSLVDCARDDSRWNHDVQPCTLAEGIQLLCADVAGGSETPSMSKKILEWKEKSDKTVWNTLIARNDIARQSLDTLRNLQKSNPKEFASQLNAFSLVKSKDWTASNEISTRLIECRKAFLDVRESLRLVGELSGVPVEPKEQQLLCDASLNEVPGVLSCGVPGAGGFDAVFALVLGKEAARKLEVFWEQYKGEGEAKVCALLLRQSSDSGVTMEQVESKSASPSKKPKTTA